MNGRRAQASRAAIDQDFLTGSSTPNRFDEIESGIKGAIDFLRKELLVYSFDMLPYPGLIVPLTVFFATNKADGQKYTDKQFGEMREG